MTGRFDTSRIVCNPIDLPYRYQEIRQLGGRRSVHREGADPSVVHYKGRYYMFVSMSQGFFHSEDLVRWEYRPTTKLPALDYAPDVRVVGDALLISASRLRENCPFFRSLDPLADDFEEVTPGSFPFFDPNVFEDDDGSLYLYWGCSNSAPLSATRLDPETLEAVGEKVEFGRSDIATRGWERVGADFVPAKPTGLVGRLVHAALGDAPFIEGSWMTKHRDTYYLQYAAPGSDWNTYADGYYTAHTPLGPFSYATASPFSSKPGGFIPGARHGSTFPDVHGNWWHVATMRISVNHQFERRVGIFPAGFDDDGVLFCNQNFGDHPMVVPDRPFDPWTEASPGWRLLSLGATATASSSRAGHPPGLAVDEDVRTWWVAGSAAHGEWIQLDLGVVKSIASVQVNHADHELAAHAPRRPDAARLNLERRAIYPEWTPTEVLVEVSGDGESWTPVHDSRDTGEDAPHRLVVLDAPVQARFVRVTGGRMPFGAPLALSGVRVFGSAEGEAPGAVVPRVTRVDPLTARLRWYAADRAHTVTTSATARRPTSSTTRGSSTGGRSCCSRPSMRARQPPRAASTTSCSTIGQTAILMCSQ